MSVSARHRSVTSIGRDHGFTLIEVLIAVVVMSFGLLGLAALQMTSLKNNHSAHHRAQATLFAEDIADRMRANRSGALAGEYNLAPGETPPSGSSVAASDLTSWRAALAARLPSGSGSLTLDGGTNIVTITVTWDDGRGTDGDSSQQWLTETEL